LCTSSVTQNDNAFPAMRPITLLHGKTF